METPQIGLRFNIFIAWSSQWLEILAFHYIVYELIDNSEVFDINGTYNIVEDREQTGNSHMGSGKRKEWVWAERVVLNCQSKYLSCLMLLLSFLLYFS